MIDKTKSLYKEFAFTAKDEEFPVDIDVGAEIGATKPSAYFKDGHWGQSLELLQHLCQYSDNIVLVIGEDGLGKTTLKQALLTANSAVFKCCDLNATNYNDIDDLLADVAVGFGIATNDQSDLADNIAELSAYDRKTWVLLIDNAHILSPEALHELVKLQHVAANTKVKGNVRFRLVLLGLAGLEAAVEAVKLQVGKPGNTHVLELEPLTLAEVEAYLLYKWQLLDNGEVFPFDSATIKKIHQFSVGNPGEIERLILDKLAGVKLGKEKKKQCGCIPKIALAPIFKATLIIGCLSALAIFLLQPLLINSANESLIKLEMPVEPAKPVLASQAVALPIPVVEEKAIVAQATTAIPATTVTVGNEEVLPRVLELERLAKQNLAQAGKGQDLSPNMVTQEANQLENAQDTRSTIDKPIDKVAVEKIPANNKSAKNIADKHASKTLAMPSGHYTLQLLGVSKLSGIEQFIVNHKLQKQAYYYRDRQKKHPWYVLVFGNYQTREQAKAAIAKLPAPVRALHPWVKEVAVIKATAAGN